MSEDVGGSARRPALIDRLGDALSYGCSAIAAVALLCIVAINGANVVARYVFVAPFSWAEEAMLFLIILSVFSGAIAVTWRHMHIRIDTFVDFAPPNVRLALIAIGTAVAIAAILTIVYASAKIVWLLYELDQRSDAMELPSWIPQSFLTIGLAVVALLMAVRTVLMIVRPAEAPQDANS